MNSKWSFQLNNRDLTDKLSQELEVHHVTANILINRGIKTKEDGINFLRPQLSQLPNPSLLPDMEKAIERTYKAIIKNESITVFGDYDADGITSASVIVKFFMDCDINVNYYIPNRLTEGYSLNREALDAIKSNGSSLVITTDCGTSSIEEVKYASKLGIETIITDHHEVPETLPKAVAIINPKRMTESKEFHELAGVGIAFYFIAALRSKLRAEKHYKGKEPDIRRYLDLVAIGTIADVAPLTGINRILVKHGLEELKVSSNYGINALAQAASTDLRDIDATGVAFRLAPRINAAGRLGNQNMAMQLLLADNPKDAVEIAEKLSEMNTKRQAIEKKILIEAKDILENSNNNRFSIILASENWHPGVIGIVSSRLARDFRKPCALISIDGEIARGSIRGIGSFNVTEALSQCSKLLINYGGHMSAGGFDIKTDKIEEFQKVFDKYSENNLSKKDTEEVLNLEAQIDLSDINDQLINEFNQLSPFGEGNPQPVISTQPCNPGNIRIVGNKHLKLLITDNGFKIDAIGFNLGELKIYKDNKYQFAGIPQFNHWNGTKSIQLNLKDIKAL